MATGKLPIGDNDTAKAAPKTIVKEVHEVVETLVVTLSRQELYDMIWEISVAGVAKEYDIPYPQLMKQVKAANIPIPPSGYLTKLSFGKPVEKIPLDNPKDSVVSLVKAVKTIISHEIVSTPVTPKTNKAKQKIAANESVLPLLEDDKAIITTVPEDYEPVETYKQYGQASNSYNREKLYQEVWKKPVTEVAKLYKVSDVAIHKVCKPLDIPILGLGYWAKVKAGRPVEQTPLPHGDKPVTKPGLRTGLEPQPQIATEALQFLTPEDKSVILSVATQITLPDEDARMHAKIVAHRKKVVEWHKESRKQDQYCNRRNKHTIPFPADTISETTLPRVCRIFDALIKAIEPLSSTTV